MPIFSWLKRRRLDEEDLREEIRSHLALAARDRMADGADARSARLASLKDFGNVALTTEAARRVWTPRWLDALRDLVGDLGHAVRTLARNPGFSSTVIAVLTLGIGLNAAVFTMLKSIWLTPIAGVERSASLAVIYGETSAGRPLRVSYPDYQYLRDHDEAFAELFGSNVATIILGRGRGARQIWGELVTGNYFQVLGVRAQRGRTLLPADEIAPGLHPVVVLSDGLWRREYGADPDIVGKTLEINNHQLTVVGVADATFHGTIVSYDVEVFIPVMTAPELGFTFGSQAATPSGVLTDRHAGVFYPHGYLRPGISLANATARTDALWSALSRERPLADAAERLKAVPFWQTPNSGPTFILPSLTVLSVMGLLVLLIACANIAGLVLVRGMARRGEIAVRLALGATRGRVVRLLIAENLVLALPGAVFGAVLAARGLPVLVGYADALAAPDRLFFNIAVDRVVIGFTALVACASALVFGFVPALQSSRIDLVSVINEDGAPRGASRGRLRAGLVVAQVAVSLALLVGAGLASRSVAAARGADPGFDARHVTAIALDLKQNGYDEQRGRVFYRKLLDAARADASIEAATLAQNIPMGLIDTRSTGVSIEGYEPNRGEDLAFMSNVVGSDYFRTVRIPLRAGRTFEDRDDEAGAPVAVVNETLARRFWGGAANAIGKRIRVADSEWRTVVGVAADVKYSRINEGPRPYFYLPFPQAYRSSMVLHTRGEAPVERLVEQARARVAAIDADMPVVYARPMADQTRGALIFFDLTATMLFIFGAAGIGLAAIGTYGLVAYTVRQSTREIGIRMALGAPGASVVGIFLVRGLRLGTIGAVIGIVAAIVVARMLGSVLYGVSATDAASFAGALAAVLGGVIVATVLPAWRAARTNPLTALRHH